MFTDDVIEAMAETPNVMPQLHMPLQSGSDKVLKEMRRSYRSKKFLGILERVRDRMPHAAISTDIIVGFPGETEEDFQDTLRVVEESRFATAFTFQYSPRPGTPAAEYQNQIPKAVVQERFERLTALQDRIAKEENAKQLGTTVEVLVADNSGRKAEATGRLTGRSRDQRLVHFSVPEGAAVPRPGDVVTVPITEVGSFHLVSDPSAEQYALRATRAGDAWDRAQADSCGVPTPGASKSTKGVSLGMPTLRVGV
jgi:tRNA-2-methylthio-N6-dimethylallyladenosine synthase